MLKKAKHQNLAVLEVSINAMMETSRRTTMLKEKIEQAEEIIQTIDDAEWQVKLASWWNEWWNVLGNDHQSVQSAIKVWILPEMIQKIEKASRSTDEPSKIINLVELITVNDDVFKDRPSEADDWRMLLLDVFVRPAMLNNGKTFVSS